MDKPPIITYDLVTGQLKIIMASAIAYSLGRGWLTGADAGIITSILTAAGTLAIPMAWSAYSNARTKKVPADSVAIEPHTPGDATAPVGSNVAGKVVGLIALLILGALAFPGDASAQGRPLQLTGNPVADTKANLGIGRPATGLTGNPLGDIIGALDVKLLPDLQYALKLATASGSKVTAPCYQAWIDIINVRQKAVQDDQTPPQALPMPDPHLITDFEKLVELRNSLQPDSEFMIRCSPVASMVKKDIVGFIGIVISGGAGLATLVPGL